MKISMKQRREFMDELENGKVKPTTPLQKKFIVEYVNNGCKKVKAAEKLGIPSRTVYHWFETNESFRRELEIAEDSIYEGLRASMFARANSKSDTLLIFALKSRYPEDYDDNIRALNWRHKQLTEGEGAAPIQITFVREPEPDVTVLDNVKTIDFHGKLNGTNGHAEGHIESDPDDE